MSANQETFRTTIVTAQATKTAAIIAAEQKRQSTVDAALSVVGYRPGFPTGNATYIAAVAAANLQKRLDLDAAETARQGAVYGARDTLRSQNEI
jgi:hypothetical protein